MNNSSKLRILIIEDKQDLAENIGDYLERQGHVADFAADGIGGLHLALTQTYDVIVLDIMLPGMDGLTLCSRLRKEAEIHTPVIMLTARDTLEDKLSGFDSGADDYLVKPFALQELAARIGVLARRSAVNPKTLSVADLELDLGTLKVKRAGHAVELTRTCLNILKILMQESPNVVTRQELEHKVWGDMPPGSDSLRSHIYTLRQKIDKQFETSLVHTISGIGYQLAEKNKNE